MGLPFQVILKMCSHGIIIQIPASRKQREKLPPLSTEILRIHVKIRVSLFSLSFSNNFSAFVCAGKILLQLEWGMEHNT